MGWSGFLKGFSALIVAIALLAGGGYAIFQFLIYQFTSPPPRPTFSNDNPSPAAKAPETSPSPTTTPSPATASPKPSPSPSPRPSPSTSPTTKRARITLSEGLNIRQAPAADAERIDGVDYNDEVIILEESPDKEWTKVRVASTGVEGWIKSGYTEPMPASPAR